MLFKKIKFNWFYLGVTWVLGVFTITLNMLIAPVVRPVISIKLYWAIIFIIIQRLNKYINRGRSIPKVFWVCKKMDYKYKICNRYLIMFTGCLTSILQVFLGVQAGVILQVYKEHLSRLSRWILWAVFCGLLGGILCGFSKEDGVIPVNKNLWYV